LPVNNSFTQRAHFNKDDHIAFVNDDHIAFVNDGLKRICAAYSIPCINIHDAFLDDQKKLNKAYTYDGLHLNAEGYKLWAAILKPYIF